MKNPLIELLHDRKNGREQAVYAACTANEVVLKAVLKKAKEYDVLAVIEATANQVDQNGGYTGMKPQDFKDLVYRIADEIEFPHERIMLGGDHLGPLTVAHLPEVEAMAYARELIKTYAQAGYQKIHVDTSMRLGDDDPNALLADEVIARRAAELIKVALEHNASGMDIAFVVGSEVPIPGGAVELYEVEVTSVADFEKTMKAFETVFEAHDLSDIWQQIVGVVVQPGVEERDSEAVRYNRAKAKDLVAALDQFDPLVFEGHSSDYQSRQHLREMAEDGIAILKVGPGLTFAYREALFALAHIEKLLIEPEYQSNFIDVLESAMLADPSRWEKYYTGTAQEVAVKRAYSFSDRSRYYLPLPAVQAAINTLMTNLKGEIPLNLLSQFAPIQYRQIIEGHLENDAEAIILDWIGITCEDYIYACLK